MVHTQFVLVYVQLVHGRRPPQAEHHITCNSMLYLNLTQLYMASSVKHM